MQKSPAIFFLLSCLLAFLLSCSPSKQDQRNNQGPVIQEVRSENGILEARLSVLNNKLHGKAIRYYRDGKIKTESEYINNKLEGIERKFYQDGNLYRTREYKAGILDGYEHRYYRNGQVKTRVKYKNDNPSTGLEEFKSNGIKLVDYPTVKFGLIFERDYKEQILLQVFLNNDYTNVRYYEGELIEDKYFDNKAIPLSSSRGVAEKRIEPDFSGEIVISCKGITPFRGLYITSAKVIIDKGKIINTILL